MTSRTVCLALLTDAFGGRGGIAQYNRDLAIALSGVAGLDDLDILPRHAPDRFGGLPPKATQRRPCPGRLRYAWEALRIALARKPALVFCGHLFMAPLAAFIARCIGARLVVQVHGIEAWTRPGRLQRWGVEAADLILTVSRDTRARVLEWAAVPPERVRVIPNTVADHFTPGDSTACRRRLGLEGAYVLLTVARLAAAERYKGHDRIIRLLRRLPAGGRRVIYLIAGDGDDRPRLEALAAAEGVAPQVRFLGHAPQAELPELYRAADLFVLPSTGEGFGIVLLEAMACGSPAIGLAAGGAVDALADGALGVAAEASELAAAMTSAMLRPCSDVDLPRRVRARFGREAFERRIACAFARVLPRSAASPESRAA